MKTNMLYYIISILMIGIITASCNDKSKENIGDIKEDVQVLNEDLKEFTVEEASEMELTLLSNWESFKTRSEDAILKTDQEIEKLQLELTKAVKKDQTILSKKLDSINQKSNQLKGKLEEQKNLFVNNMITFNQEAIDKQLSFEREFNHDMEELKTALQDIFKNNVK